MFPKNSRTRYLCILLLSIFFCCCKNSGTQNVEGIIEKHPFTAQESILPPNYLAQIKGLIERSKYYEGRNQPDSVFHYDSLLYTTSRLVNDVKHMAKGSAYMAYDYREENRLDSAYHYYNISQKNYRTIADSQQVAKKMLEMADIEYRQAAYIQSKETLTELLPFLDSIRNPTLFGRTLNLLAHNFTELGDSIMAEAFYKNAIESDTSITNKILYSNNLGYLYQRQKRLADARNIFAGLVRSMPKQLNRAEMARIEHNLAYTDWLLEKQDPLEVFQKVLKLRKEEKDVWGLLSSYYALFEYFLARDKNRAKKYKDSLTNLSKMIKNPNPEVRVLTDLLMDNPKTNAALAPRLIELKDSIQGERQRFANQFAYLRYLDQQEKNEILNLRSKQAESRAKLSNEKSQKTVYLSLLALVLMGSICYYLVSKQWHKREKLKEVYNTEMKIGQELHDGLANKTYGVLLRAQRSYPEDTQLIDEIGMVYGAIREVSHNSLPVMPGKNFGYQLTDLIDSFRMQNLSIITRGIHSIEWSKLSEQKQVVVHRALTELLVNMRKHSHAKLVSITFSKEKSLLKIKYYDNGIGLEKDMKKGRGLSNTENRIAFLGGTFTFGKGENGGTFATISIPA